ncbi:MAG: hypothetical protein ACLSA6_13650 [Holdemania massiliensis]
MKYREKGKIPAKTSLLGFRLHAFSVTEDGKINRPETMKMLDYALNTASIISTRPIRITTLKVKSS